MPLPWNSQRPADTDEPEDLSQISKGSLDSTPAEKMQGVFLLVGTIPHRSADSPRPLKSLGPVPVSTEEKPSEPISTVSPVLQKDEARQEAQESAPTAALPVIQEIQALPHHTRHTGQVPQRTPPSHQGAPADGDEEPLPLNFLALKKKYRS